MKTLVKIRLDVKKVSADKQCSRIFEWKVSSKVDDTDET